MASNGRRGRSVGVWGATIAWACAMSLTHPGRAADEPRPASTSPTVDYTIIVTGTELLAGVYADGHTQFLTRTLRPVGLHCVGSVTVDDKPTEIKDALRFAQAKSRFAIVTGGLGPTDNDITRETLAEFLGIPLHEHPEALADMERRFQVPRDQLRANLRRQTQVPVGGTYLKNASGTAVGLIFEQEQFVLVALPGPPRELQPMVRDELIPYLARRYGTRLPGCSLTLRFVGLGQSQIDQTIEEHMTLAPDIAVSSQFEAGRVDFQFSLPDDTPEARARLAKLRDAILEHLGDHVYATDETTLEQSVLKLLETRGATLALAEVGSGGALAAGLDGADTAARVVLGAFVAPSEDRLRRLLGVADADWNAAAASDARANQLAQTVVARTSSAWAVVVGQPESQPDGARYVDAAFRAPDGAARVQRFALRGTGELSRQSLNTQILDVLRRQLLSPARAKTGN